MEITREITDKYLGQWIGFAEDGETVVAAGRTPKEVLEKAEKLGLEPPRLYFVQEIVPFIGAMNGEIPVR